MPLGLGTGLSKSGIVTPGIVTDNLVLKHNYNAGVVVPVSDGAAYFDGTNDYIQTPDAFDHNNITVSAWIRRTGDLSITRCIWSNRQADDEAVLFYVSQSGNQTVKINGTGSSSGGAIDANRWYHVAFTWDGSTMKQYKDGVLVTTDSKSGTMTAGGSNARIGKDAHSNRYFWEGNMCNVGIWSGVLTQAQIKSIMWKNYAGLTDSEKTNLVSWWNLDTLIDDASTSQYQSTTIGAVYDNHNSALGENLFDNETFDNTDAVYSTTAATYDISGPGITINGTGTGETSTNQKIDLGSFSVTAGDLYLISFDITAKNDVTNSGIIVNNTSLKRNLDHFDEDADHYWYPAVIGTHETICIPHSSSFSLQLHIGTNPGGTASFDNVKVRKLGGNPGELK